MKKKKKWFRALVRQRFFIILLLVLQLAAIIFFLANRSHASVAIKYMLQIVSFIVALHIIAKRDKGAYKLTWVFTILIFPLFGGCLSFVPLSDPIQKAADDHAEYHGHNKARGTSAR